ncbi:hypothetical protein [Caulobacter soli]|uniref:hypothetical protein n=1 Tax=Caulobacter soli TaxID=2708539 RepID=UPI0013ECB8F4|nr:hypothetical protein [Caulobacter soli]
MSQSEGLRVATAGKVLGWSLAAAALAVAIIFMSGGGSENGFITLLLGCGVLGVVIGLGMLVVASLSKVGRAIGGAVSLRTDPERIMPLVAVAEIFADDRVPQPTVTAPPVEGAWLSISRDLDALKGHAAYLDTLKGQAETCANQAVSTFTADREKLRHQQGQVLRWAHRGKQALKWVEGLEGLRADASGLPQLARLRLPPAPTYLTPAQFARKYSILPSSTGHAMGRLMVANGGLGNPTNIGMAVAAAGVLALRAKSTVSKAKRAVADAQGAIGGFCQEAQSTIALLGRAHEEMVDVSGRLKAVEREIEGLIIDVTSQVSARVALSNLSAEGRSKVAQLYYWTLAADQVARQAPA